MSIFTTFGLVVILCGLIFLLAGLIQHRFPPKKINALYGYRTKNSMQSQERWTFAQRYSANQFIRIGLALCAVAILGQWLPISKLWGVLLALVLVILATILLIRRVEKRITQKFESSDSVRTN